MRFGMLVVPCVPEESILSRHRIGRSLLALHGDKLPSRAIFSHEDAGVAATGHGAAGVQAVHYVVPVEHSLHAPVANPWIVARRLSGSLPRHPGAAAPAPQAEHEEVRRDAPRARALKETRLRIDSTYRVSRSRGPGAVSPEP